MHTRLALAALLAAAAPVPALAQEAARDNIDALIEQHAKAAKVPSAFVHKVVKRESNYNPRAKGGSALGLMQIKHATARGLGYKGDASGLYDPETNLKYGIAYLAGAYRAAKGNVDQAYGYYRRGYYYAAKRLGIENEVPDEAPVAVAAAGSASDFTSLFGLRTGQPAAGPGVAGTPALAFAGAAAPLGAVEVPLPPRRPVSLGGNAESLAEPVQVAAAEAPAGKQAAPAPSAHPTVPSATAAAEMVEVPLPPRRPAATVLAAVSRPVAVARKPAEPSPVLEATAAPAQ